MLSCWPHIIFSLNLKDFQDFNKIVILRYLILYHFHLHHPLKILIVFSVNNCKIKIILTRFCLCIEPPSPPTGLRTSEASVRSVRLSWQPSSAEEGLVENYVVRYWRNDGEFMTSLVQLWDLHVKPIINLTS